MAAAVALVRLMTILIVAAALPCRAEDVISGRWEGTARVPDEELTVVVDLAQENGAWVGSIIIPGLDVKGTPLTDIKVQSPDINFAVKGPLRIRMNLWLLDAEKSWPAILSRPEIAHRQRCKKPDSRRLSIRRGTRQW